eukprot:Em0020g357a
MMSTENNGTYQTSLDDRFTFIKQAGKGTYGTTWIAEDKTTGNKKELKYSKHLSKHPNIITTHDTAYETKTSYVMVQDYAPGGDLFDAIELGLSEEKVRIYLGQIAKALDYMHSKKLVHRDIKPENIVLGDLEGSLVQLIDFGMTLRTGTHVSRICGSIPYTTPEICNASDETGFYVHPSCDVWSVGVLLFCMLTSSFPWEQATLSDSNFYEFVQWQASGPGAKPPHMWQHFSPQLLELFRKLLAIEPKDRCKITEVFRYLHVPWFADQPAAAPVVPATAVVPAAAVVSLSYETGLYDAYNVHGSPQCGLSSDWTTRNGHNSHYMSVTAC